MSCHDTPLPMAQFHTMAAATMGKCPAWDRAIANYLAADIKMRAQEVYGPLARQKDDDTLEAWAMEARHGRNWRDKPEGTDVAAQHVRRLVAYEEACAPDSMSRNGRRCATSCGPLRRRSLRWRGKRRSLNGRI